MSYIDRLDYKILRTDGTDFPTMAENLLRQVNINGNIIRLVVFGDSENGQEYLERIAVLQETAGRYFADKTPVLSYISQPPLDSGLIMEVHYCRESDDDLISYKNVNGLSYVSVENAEGRFLYSCIGCEDMYADTLSQSERIFNSVGNILAHEGFKPDDIVRQWNYIEDVVGFTDERQHYQMFNNARSGFYGQAEWANGYPAATGIGMKKGGIVVEFDAAVFNIPSYSITPIDNKLQIAAHSYSEDVLKKAGAVRSTPKFERAKSIDDGHSCLIYISGTAAIRGEESMAEVGVVEQFEITMENIAQLIGNSMPLILRVYLKHESSYPQIKGRLEAMFPTCPISYLKADICRDELLIEIEGIARK